MHLNEKQAKRILDFLASKIKHAVFTLKFSNDRPFAGVNYVAGSCLCSSLKVSRSNDTEIHILADSFKSYKQCLKRLLDLSKDGYLIEVYADMSLCKSNMYYKSNTYSYVQFLAPFSTLEQLLVEMDLENGLDRR